MYIRIIRTARMERALRAKIRAQIYKNLTDTRAFAIRLRSHNDMLRRNYVPASVYYHKNIRTILPSQAFQLAVTKFQHVIIKIAPCVAVIVFLLSL